MNIVKCILITSFFVSVFAREPILNRFKSWASDFNVDIRDEITPFLI